MILGFLNDIFGSASPSAAKNIAAAQGAFQLCEEFTLKEEGGFVDDPNDPGGATNEGITLATLRTYEHNNSLGVSAIRLLSPATRDGIYGSLFWNTMGCPGLPAGVNLMVFDHGVMAGAIRSAKLLQTELGFNGDNVDGSVGPATIAAALRADPETLINDLRFGQLKYYKSCVDWSSFGPGWTARITRRTAAAKAMLS